MTRWPRRSAARSPSSRSPNLANWTDRIAGGELPFAKPERPQGVERNVVITEWDWADPKAYLHDQVSTDKRKPTVNANGKHYGATEESREYFPVFDPNDEHAEHGHDAGARSAGMESTKEAHHGAVGLLGRRGDLGLPDQHAQPDHG